MSYETDSRWLLDIKYNGHVNNGYKSDLKRLKDGEPLDYVIGHSDFLNTRISLLHNPLIPRVETEFWVNQAINDIKKNEQVDILDIFSGSGCIGVALLKHLACASVSFSEIREDLLTTIEESIGLNLLEERDYKIIRSDVFEDVFGRFDYIFSNPPYIDKARNSADSSVVKYEPHSALYAEDNGLKYIKRIIVESPDYLKDEGVLYIEFDSWQKDAIEEFLKNETHPYEKTEFLLDQYSIPRVLRLSL